MVAKLWFNSSLSLYLTHTMQISPNTSDTWQPLHFQILNYTMKAQDFNIFSSLLDLYIAFISML